MKPHICMACKNEIRPSKNRTVNKLFCCMACRRAYYRDRDVALCQRQGCSAPLGNHQKRFCSRACYAAATRVVRPLCQRQGCPNALPRGHTRFCCSSCERAHLSLKGGGVPLFAQYTAADAERVRSLFFEAHVSLRCISRDMGVSLGKVTRIIYGQRSRRAQQEKELGK